MFAVDGDSGKITNVKWVGTRSTIQLKSSNYYLVCMCGSKSAMVCMGKSEDNLQEFGFCSPPDHVMLKDLIQVISNPPA